MDQRVEITRIGQTRELDGGDLRDQIAVGAGAQVGALRQQHVDGACDARNAGALARRGPRSVHHLRAQSFEPLVQEHARLAAGGEATVDRVEGRGGVAVCDRPQEGLQQLGGCAACERVQILQPDDAVRARGDQLFEQRLRIAQPPRRAARDGVRDVIVELDAFLARELAQPLRHQRDGDRAEFDALAAALERVGELVLFGGAEDELHALRRLFQRLQERVERREGEHVDLVDDPDAMRRAHRRVPDLLAQVAHVFDVVVRRGVELDDVEVDPRGDVTTRGTRAARLDVPTVIVRGGGVPGGTVRVSGAVQGLREDARRGGLADPARTDEQVGVPDAARAQRVPQNARNVLLADHVVEAKWPVLAGQYLV